MQCYIILYSHEGYFIIFEKREEGFFFQGVIYPPNGILIPIANGAGLYAFPGGALNVGEQPFEGCLREFTEECGADIVFGYGHQAPSLLTLTTLTINGSIYNILSNDLNTVTGNYHTLYLQFNTDDLRQIQNIVLNNIEQANQVRRDIHYNEIRNYNQIFIGYPFCPLDDELGNSQLWQVQREINEIRLLRQSQYTNWYYDMIVYLANTILNLGIRY